MLAVRLRLWLGAINNNGSRAEMDFLIDIATGIVEWVARKLGLFKGGSTKYAEARFDSETGKQIHDE